ncbi:Sec1 family-domain-containing protein [Russula earlei]|uniref:Sec1 family-domain-containing protein n=1 Tax=Russula earlei TaxID=71964 RepID=A0ACC0UG22_9AGAM|nr:Sec1 family-domain-containing protein [Russula earlei]
MDVVKAVETYITRMVSVPSAMKVLLLDSHTTPIVSLASTQSVLLSHQVYLTDRIDNTKRDRMAHMKCICFLQNSEDSLGALEVELKEPKYGEYYLYFSNILTKTAIERLADADEYEAVREVQEYFADYAPLLPSLFSLNYTPSPSTPLYGSSPSTWDAKALDRHVQGLIAVMLSLKKKPVIRYEKMSAMARKLAVELHSRIQAESQLFDFRLTQVPPLLLILDRRNDPVTPMLSQWTYQAMVHELLGIRNGRVDMSRVPDIRPELSEITLTTSTDPFFQAHHFATFGDLGTALKSYVQSYQARSVAQQPSSINSISEMKRFVEEYPEFRKLGGNVSKHVALVGELSRLVERDRLLELGEVEQGLSTRAGADVKSVQAFITNNGISSRNKLRLLILYALRYQKTQANNIASLITLALQNGVRSEEARLVYAILNIAGADHRQDDLYSTGSLLALGRSALKGLKGVENVYMQHTPHLSETLENLLKGKLKESSHAFLESAGPNAGLQRPQDVIVFVIGGTTYEEARAVALLNQEPTSGSTGGARLLLGGTCVHNSVSFLEMTDFAAANFSPAVYEPPPESASTAPALNVNLGGTMEDVKVRTRTGAFLTLVSVSIIFFFTVIEFLDYRRISIETSVVVDRSRGEKLNVHLNVTFPRVPCYREFPPASHSSCPPRVRRMKHQVCLVLSLDLMDISGELQRDIAHDVIKTRLTAAGTAVPGSQVPELGNDLDKLTKQRAEGYCGSCFGGDPPEGGCCNSCDAVRQAYSRKGWSFSNPAGIDQCVEEHWSERIQEQSSEGCNVAGLVRVNKVVGNVHLSLGRSFQATQARVYELVPYLRNDGNRHDFSHTIHHVFFTADDEADESKAQISKEMRSRMGIHRHPLDEYLARTSKAQYMFHYFLKVVSTQFRTLDGQVVNSHQYSVTHFERDLTTGVLDSTREGLQVQHGVNGMPGVFFSYEISPILVAHRETRQSFAHLLTSTCAIVGGVLTVASIVDSVLFATQRSLKRSAGSNGHANGKLM